MHLPAADPCRQSPPPYSGSRPPPTTHRVGRQFGSPPHRATIVAPDVPPWPSQNLALPAVTPDWLLSCFLRKIKPPTDRSANNAARLLPRCSSSAVWCTPSGTGAAPIADRVTLLCSSGGMPTSGSVLQVHGAVMWFGCRWSWMFSALLSVVFVVEV